MNVFIEKLLTGLMRIGIISFVVRKHDNKPIQSDVV